MNPKLLMYLARKAYELMGDPAPVVEMIDADAISIGIVCDCGRPYCRLFYIPDGGDHFRAVCLELHFARKQCQCHENPED